MKTKAHDVLEHFKKVDPVLYSVATKIGPLELVKPRVPDDYFLSLCREIIGQQLAKGAAHAIFDRFVNLFYLEEFPKTHDFSRGMRIQKLFGMICFKKPWTL